MSDKPKDLKSLAAGLRAKIGQPANQLGAGKTRRSLAETLAQLAGTLGGTPESRKLLASGRVEEAARLEAEVTPVEVYVLADNTGSMEYTIKEVRDHIGYVADVLFRAGANTRMAVWGIEDHYDAHLDVQLGVFPAPLTNHPEELRRQINALQTTFTGGWDFAECYECGWAEVAQAIGTAQERGASKPGTKRAIITFMETAAHGQLQELGYMKGYDQIPRTRIGAMFSSLTDNLTDTGCPYGMNWRQALSAAKAFAHQWYLIDCDADQGHLPQYKAAKRACVDPERENERLVELGKVRDIVPSLLCALVEQTRGPASFLNYMQHLAATDPVASGTVAGLLGAGTKQR